MNENNSIIKIAAAGFVALVVVPTVIGVAYTPGIVPTVTGICKLVHKAKIKKGLKNGSIIEINGEYYNITVED